MYSNGHVLLGIRVSTCYMSKSYYLGNPQLYDVPKFRSTIQSLQVGNRAHVNAIFCNSSCHENSPTQIEVYILVSETQDSIDLVLGMENFFKFEAELSCRHFELRIQNRSIPVFPLENLL